MRFRLLALNAGVAAVLAVAGCGSTRSGSVALPPSPPGAEALFSAEEIASARTLCLNKCVRCHKFYDPVKYSDEQWRKWMTKMSKKARLKESEAELLGRYLGTFRQTQPTNSPASGGAKPQPK